MKTLKRNILCTLLGSVFMTATATGAMLFSTAKLNKAKYPVFGVDVSNYQGDINWQELEAQNVSFAFIKATEGSGHTDESIRRNMERAAETGIAVSLLIQLLRDSRLSKPLAAHHRTIYRSVLPHTRWRSRPGPYRPSRHTKAPD